MTAPERGMLITQHARALRLLEEQPDLRISQLADHLEATTRTALRIIAELEASGLLHKQRIGRRNRYKVMHVSWLQHAVQDDAQRRGRADHPASDIA